MMMRYLLVSVMFATYACSSAPSRQRAPLPTSSQTPSSAAQESRHQELTPEALSQVVATKTQAGTVADPTTSAINQDELRGEVAKSYAGMRTRDGKSLSALQQEQATQHTLGLVDASQRRDYLGMSSSAQSLMSVLQAANPTRAGLVDGLALAKAIQDVVAASLQANVQEILKAVSAIVAAAMA